MQKKDFLPSSKSKKGGTTEEFVTYLWREYSGCEHESGSFQGLRA